LRRAAGDALRVLLGLTLGLVLAELGVRFWLEWLPQPSNGTYLADPQIGYRLRPQPALGDTVGNPYHVNAYGFRDREHAPSKPPGVRRVLGIGDSFVAGEVPLPANFLRVAERDWNKNPSPRPASRPDSVEVILMGLGGYGPEQYLGVLRSVGLATDPDLVLLCFYVGNDVTGISTRHEVRRGELYSTSSSNPWMNLLRRSHLFAWLEKRLAFRLRRTRMREYHAREAAGAPLGTASAPSSDDGTAPGSSEHPAARVPLTRLYLEVIRSRLSFYAAPTPARIERLWTEALDYLDAFDATCRNAGVPWALLIMPDEFQIDPAVRAEALRRLDARADDLDLDGPSRRLTRWASDHRVPALDLIPVFREEQDRHGPFYIPSDTHWNEKGNRLAGEAVARFADSLPGWRPRRADAPSHPDAPAPVTGTGREGPRHEIDR
jgi:hypothetical protein